MTTHVSSIRITMPMYRRISGAVLVFGSFGMGLVQAADITFGLGWFSTYDPLALCISALFMTVFPACCMPTIGYACIYQRFPQWVIDRLPKSVLDQWVRQLTTNIVGNQNLHQ